MDERLEQSLNQATYRATFENHKEKLKEILQGKLLFPYNGGSFQINIALLQELKFYMDNDKKIATLLDININPIEVNNLEEFYNDAKSTYFEAINDYKNELNQLKASRKIETVTELDIREDYEL